MKADFKIPGRLPGMNRILSMSYVRISRGASLYTVKKRAIERTIRNCIFAAGMPAFDGDVRVKIVWRERNHRRDIDNITAAAKFILDGLEATGVLKNDNQVKELVHAVAYSEEPHITVEVETL